VNIFRSGTNTLAKIISIVAGLVLWFHVTSGSTFTTNVTIPVRLVGIVRGLMVAGAVPDHILVQVHGTGRALLSYSLRKSAVRSEQPFVLVNLGNLLSGKHTITLHTDQVELGTDDLKVDRIIENAEFTVPIDVRIQRTVMVDTDSIPKFEIASDAVQVKQPEAIPKSVTVDGPGTIVRAIRAVEIKSFAPASVSLGDTLVRAVLDTAAIPFATITPAEVGFRIWLEPLAEKEFTGIPVRSGDFPAIRRTLVPDSLAVTVRGPASLIEKITPRDIAVTVLYRDFLDQAEKGGNTVKPVVTVPPGITGVSLAPERVRVSVSGSKG
jgi:hypothetical protein